MYWPRRTTPVSMRTRATTPALMAVKKRPTVMAGKPAARPLRAAALQGGEEEGHEDGGEDAGEDCGSPVVGGQGGQGEAEGGGRGQEQRAKGQGLAAIGAAAEGQDT